MKYTHAHSRYLLAYWGECWYQNARMHIREAPLDVEFMGKILHFPKGTLGELRTSTVLHWLDGVAAAALNRNAEALSEMASYEERHFYGEAPHRYNDIERAYFHLLKAFVQNEQDKSVRQALADKVTPTLTAGVITQAVNRDVEKVYYHRLEPLARIVLHLWGLLPSNLDDLARLAIERQYDYFANILPRSDEPRGSESLDLGLPETYLALHAMALLSLHHQRNGETVTFDSPYMPLSIIKAEGSTREEVLANPPIFDLEHVLETK
ncbi:Imm49 family immunity protein [Vibrio nigripulchritudo]|uniref:Imm49 family immunity protein n=1 Tax=Vibrio nigripulchritudo TaxID=28173 RepID=UPI001F1D829D|nr:Imm49 family immunity protein [Vibrio nigripulchritudo]